MANGDEDRPARLQVIILGSGGGPLESNLTSMLVRSVAAGWKKGSILAVDAGVHLAAISNLLELRSSEYSDESIELPIVLERGPFAGLEMNKRTPKANAAHVTRQLVDCCLLTHPHLDHISGFIVNTAALSGSRPKRLAALPNTIEAIKTHIFNNVIWPNLSDENNGAGLVTYTRLVEGGSPAIGVGDAKGYVEICEGLGVKAWAVSHGHCIERHSHRGSSTGPLASHTNEPPRSRPRKNSSLLSPGRGRGNSSSSHGSMGENSYCVYDSSAYFIRDFASGSEILIFGDLEPDSISLSPRNIVVWSEAAPKIASGALKAIFVECSYDDSQPTEYLFGHLSPQFLIEEMHSLANKVIELVTGGSSINTESRKRKRSSISAAISPGQNPARHLDGEISPLSQQYSPSRLSNEPYIKVTHEDSIRDGHGHVDGNGLHVRQFTPHSQNFLQDLPSPARLGHRKAASPEAHRTVPEFEEPLEFCGMNRSGSYHENHSRRMSCDDVQAQSATVQAPALPLKGLKVVIIHMKDKLDDYPHVGEKILADLQEHEKKWQLGCEFIITHVGMSLYL